jgi:hypothetical protein
MVVHPQPGGRQIDEHLTPQSGIFVTSVPRMLHPMLIKPRMRTRQRLQKTLNLRRS